MPDFDCPPAVGLDGHRARPRGLKLLDQARGLLFTRSVVDRDGVAAGRGQARGCRTDPAGAAGDDQHLGHRV
jgi:hypothetical protein